MKKFTRIREHLVYTNEYIELYDDAVQTPSGQPATYTRFRYHGNPPGAVCVPMLPDGRFLLLQVQRYAFDALSLEFPRGTANLGELAEAAARRELHEETGLVAIAAQSLGFHRPDTSIVETEVEVFLLNIPAAEQVALAEEQEGISAYHLLSPAELTAAIAASKIRDGFTLGAYGLLSAQGLLES